MFHELAGVTGHSMGQVFQLVERMDEYQQGFVRRTLLDLENFGYSIGIEGIGSQPVKRIRGKRDHPAGIQNGSNILDGFAGRVRLFKIDG